MRIRRAMAGVLVAGGCVLPTVGAPIAMADTAVGVGERGTGSSEQGTGSSTKGLLCLLHNLTTGFAPSPELCGTW
ncbi:hypothetical protein [Nocardia sp. NPDC049149]|uniref:hypothetical protein n=1 Tax=Nocardia sp. NPDC049149 TaxID=3364315 RepID=UPI0037221EE6